jgi:tetratricopeptide (TPR) repeat protein
MQMPVEVPTPEEGLRKARQSLQNGRFTDAIAASRDVLSQDPDHHEALYTLAVAQRYGGDPKAALATLDRLINLAPSYGRAWQERGHCLRDAGDAEAALSAYQEAVSRNNALLGSWQMLERNLLRRRSIIFPPCRPNYCRLQA